MSQAIQQYPAIRNTVLRILEPLGAPDEAEGVAASESETMAVAETGSLHADRKNGVAIEMRDVTVQAGGHTILSEINFRVAAGEHVAIVGPSGAGKSSLVGILLGWHKPSQGQVLVDAAPLDGRLVQSLRRETAWVDPAVQLWNRPLLQNLTYGNGNHGEALSSVIEQSDLYDVMARLPEGLQTILGEGGGLVSGGEGQRVRLGRAMDRAGIRLAVLDEPYRGLDREKRRTLLARAREYWRDATLICITHDVGETKAFDRVIVIENGRIVEDAAPASLMRRRKSRYHALLESEEQVRTGLWESADWRRLWVQDGKLSELNARELGAAEVTR
jgi:ATP-binding cassette subfamily B protein